MANPKGNPNNKGGGRKSAYVEMKVAEKIIEAFEKGFDLDKIKDIQKLLKAGKGKVNFTDLALSKALKSERMLSDLLRKVAPDRIKEESEVTMMPIKIEIVKPDDK